MRSLYLAWQAPNRAWFPVGRLDADLPAHVFKFRYTRGARQAEHEVGFQPLPAFPDFERTYESSELFPLFQNRVLDPGRKDFADYLESLDLGQSADPIAILAVSGGERQTDNFEVFPRIEALADGRFRTRFFLHGWRHMTPEAQARAMNLKAGEPLGVSVELTNRTKQFAIQLTTEDYVFLGWTPRYLVSDLLRAIAEEPEVTASVVRINSDDVPANRRVLVDLTGKLPPGVMPMSSEEFQPLAVVAH